MGANGTNPYANAVDEAEGLDKIEDLQNHEQEEIYDKAANILEAFFDIEDGEVENLAPQVRTLSAPLPPGTMPCNPCNMSVPVLHALECSEGASCPVRMLYSLSAPGLPTPCLTLQLGAGCRSSLDDEPKRLQAHIRS